jgi:predicted dehydrogenase/threonine dehydrogenase-like Zn-dependent dehydrogenase
VPPVKQVVLRSGQPHVADVPAPAPAPGRVLIANAASVISSGTERSSLSTSGGSLPMRAIRNPDLVLMTLKHAREHGVRETVELVRGAVADDTVLGYSSAGIVLDTGGIADFRVGQAVACAGAGNANHAEVVSVPGNLVAPVPDGVALRDAAFTTLGAIAMQGVRRAEPSLGERVVVVGLGLLGLLTVQILRAAGCQVVGIEPVARRRELALDLGAELALEPAGAAEAVAAWSEGVGADAVVITASTASDAVLNDAIGMVRRKGRVVPVGDVGLGIERAPLYVREADVLISTSYGPGRYDPTYEEGGVDYPIAYVRWTENRNMQAFLRLLATGQLRVDPLVDVELPVDRAAEAYGALNGGTPPLAAVLTYEAARQRTEPAAEVVHIAGRRAGKPAAGEVGVALVGAGAFVRGMHLPNLKADARVRIVAVASRRGTTARDGGRALGGGDALADWRPLLEREDVDLVVVGTRHDTHAEIAASALRAGKAVFLEKPLGLTREEIDHVWGAGRGNDRLAIGFNRPFAALSRQLEQELRAASGPVQAIYRVNAPLPREHWLNDPRQGGGRILGEACHMLDYVSWLCGTPVAVHAAATPAPAGVGSPETSTITVAYADGSIATVHYSALGPDALPKERIEVLRGGRAWVLDDFRSLTSFGPDGARTTEAKRQDKGHADLLAGVVSACRGEQPFAPGLRPAYVAQAIALAALESIASGARVEIGGPPG